MKTEVNIYRGFSIMFDTKNATFSAWSDHYDTEFCKKTYAATLKGVDDYIKENSEFRPFYIRKALGYSGKVETLSENAIKITGIRKDGKPVFKNKEGKNKAIGISDIRHYVLNQPEFDFIHAELAKEMSDYEEYSQAHRRRKAEILAKVSDFTTLRDFLTEIKQQ